MRRVAGLVPYRVWRTMPVVDTFEVVEDSISFTYRSTSDDYIGMALYWRGLKHWEHETFPLFRELSRRSRGFVDIGASTGVYSLVAGMENSNLSIVAFEPVPRVVTRLREHVLLNHLEDRVHVVESAVGPEAGRTKFFVPDGDTPTGGRVGASDGESGRIIEVAMSRLEDCLPSDFHLDLMKIDVEGFEGPLLQSVRELLAKHRPHVVVEFLSDGSYPEACEVFHSLGYHIFHLGPNGPVQQSTVRPAAQTEYRNYWCKPTAGVAMTVGDA